MATSKTAKATKARKPTTKKPAATKAPAKKQATRTRSLRTIKLVTKKNPFDLKLKRHAKWKCLKDGATVSELVAAMKKKGLSSPRTFIVNCQKMGHLKIS